MARAGLSLPRQGYGWALCNRSRVIALAIVRQRSGPQSWEVTQLFSDPRTGTDHQLADLLEKLSGTAASHGGERVFLRLRSDDPLIDVARLSGYFPCVAEVLHKGMPLRRGHSEASGAAAEEEAPLPRKKTRADHHGLFRLYNAATPQEVRSSSAMTFNQWSASHEHTSGRWREFVVETDSAITGWVGTLRRVRTGQMSTVVHPDDDRSLDSIVDFGLRRLGGAKAVYCLVPEYQVAFRSVLAQRGFNEVASYITLVKSTVSTVKKEGTHRVRVGAT